MRIVQTLTRFFPIVSVLLTVRDVILLFFTWVSRNFAKCKFFAFFSLTIASIKAAVGVYGTLFRLITQFKAVSVETGGIYAQAGVAAPSSFLDKLNAVVPVSETMAFMAAYGAVILLTTGYMFIRSLYNAAPGKMT